jgi:hypothetical protein
VGRDLPPEEFWQAVLDFIRRSAGKFECVQASVVGHVLEADEIEACRDLAASLGSDRLRVR